MRNAESYIALVEKYKNLKDQMRTLEYEVDCHCKALAVAVMPLYMKQTAYREEDRFSSDFDLIRSAMHRTKFRIEGDYLYLGYEDGESTGDEHACDMGYHRSLESICFCEEYTVPVKKYRKIKDTP